MNGRVNVEGGQADPHRRRRYLVRIPVILAVSLALVSCAALRQAVQEPQIALTGLELTRFALNEQRFRAHLDVHNPNPFRLPVRNFTWAVSVEGVHLANGLSDNAFSVGAGATERISLEFGTNLVSTALGLMGWISNPGRSLDYVIQGEVRADLPFARDIPYRHEGRVELDGS